MQQAAKRRLRHPRFCRSDSVSEMIDAVRACTKDIHIV
jgi:hypothetical protein